MADKRMFSSKIIDSDAFIEMSPMARLLYFSLALHADDDGFTNSIRREMKIVGAQDSDLKELIDNKFIIQFDSGVVAIKHWRVNNDKPKKDRYKVTLYTKEVSQIILLGNGEYALRSEVESSTYQNSNDVYTDWNQVGTTDGNNMDTQNRREENRLEKNRLEEISNCSEQEIFSELELPSKPDDCIEFPVLRGNAYIPKTLIEEWESVYTNVNVMEEVLKAREWCKANPKNLKINWRNFLVNWLNKSQDRRPRHDESYKTQGPNRCMEPDKVIEAEEAGF